MQYHSNKAVIAMSTPLRLSPQEMENPLGVVSTFFEEIKLDETREMLWEAFSVAICVDEEEKGNISRRDLLFFHAKIEALIEAAFMIYQQSK